MVFTCKYHIPAKQSECPEQTVVLNYTRTVEVCGKRVENLLGGVINSYIIKLVKLYILWTLLYLPLTFYGSCVVENKPFLVPTNVFL